MEKKPQRLLPMSEIKQRSGKSHSYVYSDILPKLDVRKVGRSTMATEESFEAYLEALPRVTFPAKLAPSPKAA